MSKVSGFTLVRNASLLHYPFPECVLSILPICDEVIINCGDSTDGTRDLCAALERQYPDQIKVMDSVWKREGQKGGFQLKSQTDAALDACTGDWAFYIQADEAIHEADLPKLKLSMERAEKIPEVDGLLFDYLHFYGNYSFTMKGRNWYRREMRAFKKGRGIQSFRDAQGFRKAQEKKPRVLPSGARVFHYGYVRTPDSLKTKSQAMAQWWGEKAPEDDEAFRLVRHVGLTPFRESHPAVMSDRVRKNSIYPDPSQARRRWNKDELKNALTLLWESVVPYRIGEYRNYELYRP